MDKLNIENHEDIRVIVRVVVALLVGSSIVSAIAALFFQTGFVSLLRMIFSVVGLLFFPGFILTFVFLPLNYQKAVDTLTSFRWIERMLLSFALSVVSVSVLLFLINIIGVAITTLSVFSSAGLIVVVGVILVLINSKKSHRNNVEDNT